MHKRILITSNSSWYLNHYRKGLTSKILKTNKSLFIISPIDSSTKDFNPNIVHIPWDISRKGYLNFYKFFIETLQTIIMVKILKPSIIHSHTLKSNLLISITAALLNIKTIISFAGFGILKTKGGFGIFLLKSILRTIFFLSRFKKTSGDSKEKLNNLRVIFIFQNPKDKKFFEDLFESRKDVLLSSRLIPGSGVPEVYFNNEKKINQNGVTRELKNVIFCGRLLKSKGIGKFLEISKYFENLNFIVYGEVDCNNQDSITQKELRKYEKNSKIIFKGNVKNPLINHLGKDSILLVPSSYGEGLSRSIAEALSSKIPVVASINCLNESFSDEILFVSKDKLESYINLIKKLTNIFSSQEIISKIERGYKFAVENLSEEKINEKTLELYEELSQTNIVNNFESKLRKEKLNWLN